MRSMRDATFFTRPIDKWQRRYEALRASFVDRLPDQLVAERFGFSVGYLRVLRHQFRHGKIDFSEPLAEGSSPRRKITAETRRKIVSWRQQNLSAGEITQLLSEEAIDISVRTIERVLAEEGFKKLPRRTQLKIGRTVKGAEIPQRAESISLSQLDGLRVASAGAGVFLFAPFIAQLRLDEVIRTANLPGNKSISAMNYFLSFLGLNLLGTERFAHVGEHVFDQGLGLFAGLNVLPKCTALSTYSYSLDAAHLLRLQDAFIRLSILLPPLTFLLGKAASLSAVILLTCIQWVTAGFCMAIVGTIMAREAGEAERGRVFGLLGMSIGLGSLAGGFSVGPMVDAWGYKGMFSALSVFLILLPLSAAIGVHETGIRETVRPVKSRAAGHSVNTALIILLVAQFFGMIANGVGNMARSISMDDLDFTNTALTSTVAVIGAVSIPTALFLGRLSDKLGRKKILLASYLSGTLCLLILIVAVRLWHFLVSASLLSMVVVSMSVGPAFVADIVKKESVGTGIALIQSIQLLGAIAGFVYTGYAFLNIGLKTSLLIASSGGLLAAILVLFIRTSAHSGSKA